VADDRVTGNVGQAEVGQHDIEGLALGRFRRLPAGRGGDDVRSFRFQQHGEHAADVLGVFDEQDPRGFQSGVDLLLHAPMPSKTNARNLDAAGAVALTLPREDGLLSRPWTHP
jgi:hypothetical protein